MARVAIIDNFTKHMPAIESALYANGHEIYTRIPYFPGDEFEETAAAAIDEVDFVWASGGGGFKREAKDKAPSGEPFYASQGRVYEIAREAGKPVLAVCMAAQAAAHYHGADVVSLSTTYRGYKQIDTDGFGTADDIDSIFQVNSQDFAIRYNSAPSRLRVRGVSTGRRYVEIFELPGLVAVQWHPELGDGTITVPRLIDILQYT